jgi:hypothetical protein
MEIVPATPVRRPGRTGRAVLGIVAAGFVLIGMIAALPVFLGMERVAMADDAMGAALPRGSYVLVERVPAGELEVGDRVSFRDPVGDGSVIRRVTSMDGGWLHLDGDVVGTESTTTRAVRVRRVESHVPWVGYPLLLLGAWPAPYLVVGLLGAAVLTGLRVSAGRYRRTLVTYAPAPAARVPRQSPGTDSSREPAVSPAPPAPPAPRAPVALP